VHHVIKTMDVFQHVLAIFNFVDFVMATFVHWCVYTEKQAEK